MSGMDPEAVNRLNAAHDVFRKSQVPWPGIRVGVASSRSFVDADCFFRLALGGAAVAVLAYQEGMVEIVARTTGVPPLNQFFPGEGKFFIALPDGADERGALNPGVIEQLKKLSGAIEGMPKMVWIHALENGQKVWVHAPEGSQPYYCSACWQTYWGFEGQGCPYCGWTTASAESRATVAILAVSADGPQPPSTR